MSLYVSPEYFYHNATRLSPQNVFCYRPSTSTSTGVWLGDNPLDFSFPLLLFQITVIFATTRITHSLLRRIDQPIVISQIIGGVLLGPSFLGRIRTVERLLFSERSWEQLNAVALLAFALFVFTIGLKTDLGMIRKTGRKAVAIAIISTTLPFASVLVASRALGHIFPVLEQQQLLIMTMAARWCLTSYVNVSCALRELHLLTSKFGRLAMSATLIADFYFLFVSSVLTAYVLGSKRDSPELAVTSVAVFVGFWIFVLLVARPTALWMVRRTPEGGPLSQAYFVMVLLMALSAALISEAMGYHMLMGSFILGLMLPSGAPLGVTVAERLDRLVAGVFLPVFLATAGMRMDLASLVDVRVWGFVEAVVLLCVVAKFTGTMLPCLYCKMPLRDALSVALMMTIKGIFEVDGAIQWQEGKLIGREGYTAILLSIIVVGGSTAPLVKYMYRPEDRFVAHMRRTVQHCRSGDELRVVACVHNQDDAAPAITLLEASHPTRDSPICIYVLHLLQLAGRNDAVLVPHKRHRSDGAAAAETDHIVNAFGYLERKNPGRVSVLPYVCISPHATMHNDICSLALDKKAALVIVPFHRRAAVSGGVDSANPAVRGVNTNVLRFAPCSVGILVDHGLAAGESGPLLHRVGVYFFGGADDREALAYAARMAEDPAIGLTLVRFRQPKEQRRGEAEEEKQDEEVVREFRLGRADGKRVVYREEEVRDGEGTVAVIRSLCGHFSLLLVGRRQGQDSPLTAGLSMWSEYPELGVIGDLLASTDYAGWVSTLVVQQQARFGAGLQVDSPRSVHRGESSGPE